jgi:hypothetical protein
VWRTIAGLVLILGAAPVFLWLVPGSKGWTVILSGLAALGAIIAGIVLAGHWLGVFRRRRENSVEQQGCLQLLVTLVALLAGAVILYYVVYYGAGAYLRGEL